MAAPLFLYSAAGQEFDNEYGGPGGLVGGGYNAQFVVQPYDRTDNLVRYVQLAGNQFTTRMQWRTDRVFRAWTGWSTSPAARDVIQKWIYTGPDIPPPGQERVCMNLWPLNGATRAGGAGDEMVVRSFTFEP